MLDSPHAAPIALLYIFAWYLSSLSLAFASPEQQATIGLHPSESTRFQITLSKQSPLSIRLEARAVSLATLLKSLANKTGVVIHYSILPETPVTATCVGEHIGKIMDCLLGSQVNRVYRYPDLSMQYGKFHLSNSIPPEEIWLLGSSLRHCPAVTIEPTISSVAPEQQITPEEQAQIDQGNQDQTDALLEKFNASKDKGVRAEALNNLIAVGKIDDPNVRNALESALLDKDDSVRAQAVETLANLDKGNATDYLNKALQDKSPEVRITALGKATGQVEILERALSDSDKNVSDYASAMLAQLKKKSEH